MLHKIQQYCLQCFNCNQKEPEEDYDYKKNEDNTLYTKEQFEKLLEEIVIINKKEEKEITKLTNLQNYIEEDEKEYVLC